MGNGGLKDYLTRHALFESYQKKFMKYVKEGQLQEFKRLFLVYLHRVEFHSIVDENGNNLVHQAVKHNQPDILRFLLSSKKLSIEDQNVDGDTALMLACIMGSLEMVTLLARGADMNAKENTGHTALMAAASNGQKEVVEYLLSRSDVDYKAKNVLGQTVIHRCAYYGELAIIKLISRETRLPLSQKDYNMNRPIHLAAEKCQMCTMRYLIRKTGQNSLHKQNSQSQTVLDILQKQFSSLVSHKVEQA